VRWVQGELLKFRPLDFGPLDKDDAVPRVRKADAREMRGRPSRYNVPDVMRGPRFTSTGPVQEPPPLASFVSQLGPPFCGPSAENNFEFVRQNCGLRRL
jgi:hypothetical protein